MRLPEEFFQPCTEVTTDITDDFTARLRNITQQLQPVPTSRHGQIVFEDLASATHVFLRKDVLRGALKPAYIRDHTQYLLENGENIFKIKLDGKTISVPIDKTH